MGFFSDVADAVKKAVPKEIKKAVPKELDVVFNPLELHRQTSGRAKRWVERKTGVPVAAQDMAALAAIGVPPQLAGLLLGQGPPRSTPVSELRSAQRSARRGGRQPRERGVEPLVLVGAGLVVLLLVVLALRR